MRTLQILIIAVAAASVSALGLAANTETLPSGVMVAHIKPGQGASPTADSAVRVHYRGTLPNGTEFDSSYKRNEPASFPLSGVIPCWTQGVQKMKVGGQSQAHLSGGYGLWRPWGSRRHSTQYQVDL